MKEKILKHFLKDIVNILKILEKHKILHRDMKFDNFMIYIHGVEYTKNQKEILKHIIEDKIEYDIVLIDFGLAWVYRSGKSLPTFNIGNWPYWAPEMPDQDNIDIKFEDYSKSDLWSIGHMIFSILYQGDNFKINKESQKYIDEQLEKIPENSLDMWYYEILSNLL